MRFYKSFCFFFFFLCPFQWLQDLNYVQRLMQTATYSEPFFWGGGRAGPERLSFIKIKKKKNHFDNIIGI